MRQEHIETITHSGVVKNVDLEKNIVEVVVNDNEDCGGCPAAKICSVSSQNSKGTLLKINTPEAKNYRRGESVTLSGKAGMQNGAILTAIIVPCVLLVGVMIIVYCITGDEALSALLGLASVVVIYFIFYLFRSRFAKRFTFTISK